MTRKKLISIQSYLFYLLPVALLTGPFFPDFFLCIIGLIFLYIVISEKKFFYFRNNFFIIFFLFYIYLIFSSLISDYRTFALENSLLYFRFGIFTLATWFLINEKENFIKVFTIIFLIVFAFAILNGFYQYFNGTNFFGYESIESRLTLTLNDKLILGGYLIRLLPLLLALLILMKITKEKKIFLCGIFVFITFILIFLTGERTAIALSLLLSILFILFIKKFRVYSILFFLGFTLTLFIISINSPQLMKRNIAFTLEQTNIVEIVSSKNTEITIFSPQHHSHIVTAYRMFLDKPLFGHGPDTFRFICSDERYWYDVMACANHPHNTYIQLLSEIGLVGILPIVIFLLHLFKRIYLNTFRFNVKNSLPNYTIILIFSLFISLWPFIPTQNFFNNWINIIYFLPLGFYLSDLYSNGKKNI